MKQRKEWLRSLLDKPRHTRLHEQLEDRILFDAAPDGALDLFESVDQSAFVPAIDGSADSLVHAATVAEQAPENPQTEIVFVDKSVAGFGVLIADLVITNNAEVIFLDQESDGLSQIAAVLQSRTDITAVHIISHGDQAELTLGTTTLTANSITGEHADELTIISGALTENADLLIYGCSFGEGEDGRAAVQALAKATGADVAASDDLTGNSALGGDWDLELRTGSVEASVLHSSHFAGVLSVEATESIVTIQDAESSAAGLVSLNQNGSPLAVTTSGTPFRVGQMLERIWQYAETGDVGDSTYVFDVSAISGITGTTAAEFGLVVSDTGDLSGANTTTLVASGYDAANRLIYFHGVNLQSGDYFALATNVIADNFSVLPAASGVEDSAIDLGLSLNPALTDGGTLQDIIDTGIGYRAHDAGTTPTEFLIPTGTTGIKITGYSTLDTGTSARDDQNDDYQSLSVSINLTDETSNGFIAHLVDQGPSRSDQFGWSDAPLGTAVLSGGAALTGDHDDNINPTFSIVDGKLQIVESHALQTAYLVEFQTNATSSAEFIQTASAVLEDGDQTNAKLEIPANAGFIVLNIADAATSSDSQVEYKGNSRIYIDLTTLRASGTVAAQRGETDNRVVTYAFEGYDISSSSVGAVIGSGATLVGDTQQTASLPNDSQIHIDADGDLVINRNNTFASSFNSLITVEYYERKDVGSSAELLGESTDYGFWNADPSDPISQLEFDIPANATLGILNLSMNGTRTSDTNENMGAGFAVIDLTTGKSSGTMYMVRTSNIVDFVAWDSTDFETVFFDDPNSISNHDKVSDFNDEFAGNAEFKLNAAGDKLILETHSNDGTQTYRDYYAGGQIQWYGSAPFELTGFPVGGTFSSGSLNNSTGNWDLTIQDALTNGLFFIPDEHVSGNQPIDVSIRIGDEVDTTVVRIEAVIDQISFDAADACGDEDTDIAIDANVTPTFVDQDGSETVTAIGLRNITIGHTISDGTNSFTATAGNQDLDITAWNRTTLTYRAQPDETGRFNVDLDIEWQDVGGGVTETASQSTAFDVIVKPVNDAPVAVNDNYLTFGDTPITTTLANGVLFNDSDPEADALSVNTTPVTGPASGNVTLNSDGTFTYTPNSGFTGTDSFVYQVSDSKGGFATATAEIKVSPLVEGPLQANNDAQSTGEEVTVNIDVTDNDNLPTVGSYSITGTTQPANGSVTVLSNGTIDYTPDADFFGTDTFDYTLTDASGRVSTATVTVTVDNVQDPPTASPNSASTPEDTTKTAIDILGNDSDPDGDMLTVTSASAPNGTVQINTDGTIDYTPNADFTGADTVTYTISDGHGNTATSTVLINVVPVADPPTSADNAVTVDEDSEIVLAETHFAFADGDPGDTLVTVRIDSVPTDGQLLFAGVPVTDGQVISRSDIVAGKLAFRPDDNESGNNYATFDYSVSDGALFQTAPNTMTVHVTNLQDPPQATDGSISVAEGSTNTPLGLATPTDLDGDLLTATVSGLPITGTITLANGTPIHNGQILTIAELTSLQYNPPADYDGGDPGNFTYTVSDGFSSDAGVVNITVSEVNDPPQIDLNGPAAAGLPGAVTIDDRAGFLASLTADSESTIIDDSNAFAVEPSAGTVTSVTRTGSIAGEVFSYTVYDIDVSNSPTGVLNPGIVGGDIADADNIKIETPASQSGAVGSGSWGVDSAGGATSTRNGFLFDFTTTPGDNGIGHFAGEFHDLESNASTTPAEYRVYQDGTLVDSGTIDWGSPNFGNSESHFFGYSVHSETDFFDQILIIVGDDGTGGGGAEQLAADRFTFGTAFVADADVDFADTFTEGGTPVAIADIGATVRDIDDTTLPSLSIDVDETTILDAGSEFLVIGGTNVQLDAIGNSITPVTISGISYDVAFTAGTAVLQITRTDATELTVSEMETVLRDVQYLNSSVLPTEADRVFIVSTTDADSVSNPAVSTISVVRSPESAVWSISGDADVIDGNVASYELNLSATLRDGETASVTLTQQDVDTDGSDLAGFAADVSAAVVAYAGPGSLAFAGGTLTFTSDGTGPMGPFTIGVTTTTDGVYEGDEDYRIRISNPGSTTGEVITVDAADEVTTTIEDNDSPITISISDGSETEGGPIEFTISMDYTSFEDIVLDLTVVGGSATAGTDFETTNFEFSTDGVAWFSATNGTEVTIPAGDTSLLVRVDTVAEGIVETNETFTLSATVLSGSVNDASDTGTGTIVNDDVPAISIDDVTVDEDNGTINFIVTLDQAPVNAPATVDWATSSGTATSGIDFPSASGSLTFGLGETSKTVAVAITNDDLYEQSETLHVDLANAGNATIADNQGIGTLIDDGSGPNGTDDDRPALSVSDATATEDVDTHAVFSVSLSNPSSQPTVVSLALNDVSATSGTDYGPALQYLDASGWKNLVGKLTIPAETTTVQVRTLILDDAVIDNNETFTLVATTVSGITTNASDSGTGTILDDPTPDDTTVELTGPGSVTEGASATYTVSIDNSPLTDVTLTFTYSGTASSGTDFAGIASVTIPAGSTTATFSVNTIDDLLGEPLESFTVTIDSITGGSLENTVISATDSSVTTQIIDDDVPTISINDVTVTEGFDPHAEFTVELSNATFEDIDISLSAAGSGTDPAIGEDSGSTVFDFGTLAADDLEVYDNGAWAALTATTITAGTTSLRLRTAIKDDAFLEGAETFTVSAAVTSGTTTNASASGLGTILDDPTDPEVVLVSLTGPSSVVEGSTTTDYTLTLTEDAAEDVVITLTYSGPATDGSDYGSVVTVTVPGPEVTPSGTIYSRSATFTLPTIDDAVYEGSENVIVTIASATGGGFESLSIDPAADTVTTAITDDADKPVVSINDVTAIEGTDDYATYTIEVTNISVEDIDLDLTLTAGTATGAGIDFDAAAGGLEVFDGTDWVAATTATIKAGEFSAQVRVPIVDDNIDEPDENYTLQVDVISGTTTNIQVVGTGTIIDDDAAPDVTIDDATASEGDFLVFDVSLSNPSSSPIVLNFSATDLSASTATDYSSATLEYSTNGGTTWLTAANGTEVTIPANSTAIQVRMLTTEDSVLETLETMRLAIVSVLNGDVGNISDTATGTITDDETALVSINANDPVAGEPSANGQFTVSMTAPSDSPTTIGYSISGTGTNGTDFSTITGSVTLPSGVMAGTIDLTIIDDTIVEGSEDVVLTLTAITSGDADISIDGTANSATATIADDDEATWKLAGDATVNEGATATYRLDLLGTLQSGESVSVDLSLTANSTNAADHATLTSALATAVSNYSGSGAVTVFGTTVTFTSDGTGAIAQLVIDIDATNDSTVEGPEDYTVAITNAVSSTGAAVAVDAAASRVNTILNDTIDAVGTSDDTASWSITGPATADEGTTASYVVSLDSALGINEAATVNIALANVDTNSGDYADFLLAVETAAANNPQVTFDGTSTLTFIAPTDGASMTDVVIELAIVNDLLIEGPESLQLKISNPASYTGASIAVNTNAASVTTIINDTAPPGGAADGPGEWSITGQTNVDEGTAAVYTISLSGIFGAGEVATITISQADLDTSSTDYNALTAAIVDAVSANAAVTFDAATGVLTYTSPSDGASLSDITVSLDTVDDTLIEGPENFQLLISNPTSSSGANISVSTTAHEVTTAINDVESPGKWSIAGETSEDEGGIASYTIALSGQYGINEVVAVDLNIDNLTANGSDYAAIVDAIATAVAARTDVAFDGTKTLTYTASADGASMADLVIDLAIVDDATVEGSENYTLQLSSPLSSTGAGISVDPAAASVTTTINDTVGVGGDPDGPAQWSIFGQTWADEGGTYPWTIKLSGLFGIGQTATAVINVSDITTNPSDYADIHAAVNLAVSSDPSLSYDSNTGTLTFTAMTDHTSMEDLTINLGITNDAWTEGPESFSIGLASPGSTTGLTQITVDTAHEIVTTEINDTQDAGLAADGPALWSLTGDTSVDEGAIASYTISLSEQFGVNETAFVSLTLTDVDTNSGDYQTFATAIQNSIAGDPTLSFSTATGILTFTSPSDGATMNDITLTLPITDDNFTEGPQDYSIRLATAGSSTGATVELDTDISVTTTIADTQGPNGVVDEPVVWSIAGAATTSEGAAADYTIAISAGLGEGERAVIDVSLADGTTNASDYTAFLTALQTAVAADSAFTLSGNTLTYTAPTDGAAASLLVNLPISDDSLIEGDENLTIVLANPTSITDANVTLDTNLDNVATTITDNDGGTWSIAGSTVVNEGSAASYTVSLSELYGAAENASITINLTDNTTSTADRDALLSSVQNAITAGGRTDLTLIGNVLTFTSSADDSAMADLQFSITASQDSTLEANEDYDITLASPATTTGIAVTLAADTVNTVINDDSDTAEVTIAATTQADEAGPINGLFTVSIGSLSSTNTVIRYTVSGPANAGDHGLVSGNVTILAGELSAEIPVPIIDDALIEGIEAVTVTLDSIVNGDAQISIGATNTATINIADNDGGEWSIAGDTSVDEASAATYTISLSGSYGASETASITLALTNNSASAVDHDALLAAVQNAIIDNSATNLTLTGNILTFTSPADGATMTPLTFSINATDDNMIEGQEDYDITLATPDSSSGATLTLGAASVNTVINDDADTTQIAIAATTHGNETGVVDGQFTVSIDIASSTDTVIAYTVGGTSNNSDYSTISGTVTIFAGDLTAAIAVPIVDDSLIEGVESVTVSLTSITSGDTQITIGDTDTASINIADNDTGQWAIAGPATVAEGSSATYTISLSGSYGGGESTSIDLNLTDNSTAAGDHGALLTAVQNAITNSGRTDLTLTGSKLTFTSPSDATSVPALTFDITATQDGTLEADEDYDVELATPASSSGITVTLGNATVNTVINDDADTAQVTIAATTHADETGPVNGLFTVSIDAPSSTDTVISYAVSGTANASDHALTSGNVTILAGQQSAVIAVPVNDDGLIEGSESVTVQLTSIVSGDDQISIGATDTASINITDNDSALWSVTGPSQVDEGGTAQYTLALPGNVQAGEIITIDLALNDIDTTTADYNTLANAMTNAIAGRSELSFSGGVLTYTSTGAPLANIVIDLTAVDDTFTEGPEAYSFVISDTQSSTGADVAIDAAKNEVTTTINDTVGDGGGPELSTWSITGDASVDEGGTASYIIELDGILQAGENTEIQLTLANIDTLNADYSEFATAVQTAIGSRTDLMFDPGTGILSFTSTGASMTPLTVSLAATDDSFIEGPERYQVQLTNANSNTGAAIQVDAIDDQVVTTINDTIGNNGANESAEWSLGIDQTVLEGNSATYTLALAGTLQAGEVVSVDLTLSDIDTTSGDYASFTAAVQAAVDACAGPGALNFNSTSATVSFISDGTAPMSPLTISLNTTADDFAEGVEDYLLRIGNPASTTGAAAAINATANLTVTTIDDTSGPDADEVSWSIVGDTSVDEGAAARYVIRLANGMQARETATIDLSISNVDTTTGDYATFVDAVDTAVATRSDLAFDSGTGTLTFTSQADGVPMNDFEFTLAATDDAFVEGPEAYSISLSNPDSTSGVATTLDATQNIVSTTINDTQGAAGIIDGPTEWTLSGDTNVAEGATAQYAISVTGKLQADETASVQLTIADIDTVSDDYADFSLSVATAVAAYNAGGDPGSLSWTNGNLTFTSDGTGPMGSLALSLASTADALAEGPERNRLNLANASSATGLSPTVSSSHRKVTTTITDDDTATWSLSGDTSVDEGDSATYTFALDGIPQLGETVAVTVNIANITTGRSDYAVFFDAIKTAADTRPDISFDPSTGRLTFTGTGSPLADFAVNLEATDDNFIEGPEAFYVTIATPTSTTGATVLVAAAANDSVTTAINDTQGANGAADGPGQWNIAGTATADEGANAAYTVSLTGAYGAGEIITVNINLADISTNTSDYGDTLTAIQNAATANPHVTFNAATGTLTYTAPADGASMADLTIILPIINDSFIEGSEQFSLNLSTAASTTGASTSIGTASVTTTINDTQGPAAATDGPAKWSISGPTSTDEGETPQYTIGLSGHFGIGEVVTVNLGLTDIATDDSDYADVLAAITAAADGNPDVTYNATTGTLIYTSPADGATMAPLVVDLLVINDSLIEGPESFRFDLSNAATSTDANVSIDSAASSVVTTINDTQGPDAATDGPAEWSITGPTSTNEGSTSQYTINLSGQFGVGEVVTVNLALSDTDTNSNDYSDIETAINVAVGSNPNVIFDAANGTLTYTAPADGASMTPLVIDLPITDDVLLEGPEDFRFDLTNATTSTGANISISATAQTVITTINDTQGATGTADGPATWSLTGPAEVAEGTSPSYTVSLSGIFQADEIVSVNIGLTDNSTDPADHASLITQIAAAVASNPNLTFNVSTGTLTYTAPADGASMTPLVISLPIADDTVVESPEDYTIGLSDPATSTGASTAIDASATAVTTIVNGDPHVYDDVLNTTVGVPVSGNVLTNDSDPDSDPLTATPTPVTPPTNGTLVLLSNGSYTYTPNPDFRGIDTFEYEVCDDWGNCETAIVTIMMADLSSSKQQTLLVPNDSNGDNFDVTFEIKVQNTGATRMDNLTLFDDVANQFGNTFLSISDVSLDTSGITTGTAPTLNTNWANNTALDIIDPANSDEYLLAGEWFTVTYTVTVDPDAGGTSAAITNQATVTGDDITTIPGTSLAVADASDSGSDPTTNNIGAAGDSGGEDDATPLHVPDLRVAKQQIGTPTQQADGSWNVDFKMIVENTGTVELSSPSLLDDVGSQFSTAWQGTSNVALDHSGVTLGGTAPGLNAAWVTDPSVDMLDGTGHLNPGESITVSFTVNVDPDNLPAGLSRAMTNQATGGGTANDSAGNAVIVTDLSDVGSEPNGTNPNQPGDSGTSDDPTPLILPEIGIAKRIIGSVPSATGGNFNVTYEAVIRNTGSVDLGQLTLLEDLESQLGNGFVTIVGNPVIYASTATTDPTFNSNWDGNLNSVGDAKMFDGLSGRLQPGEQIVVQFTVEIDIDQITPASHNQMTAGGAYDETPGGSGFEGRVSDLSDTGSDPAGNNAGQTGDSLSANDPTLIPAIGLAKQHGTPVAAGPAGEEFAVPITLTLKNLGPVELADINLVDDIRTQFGAAFVSVDSLSIDTSGVTLGTTPQLNTNWIGDGSNILDGSGTLQSGDVVVVTFNVIIDPDATGTASVLTNSATVTASDVNNPGLTVQDLSDSGVSPNTTNTGEPGDNQTADDPTPILIGDAGLAKQVTDISRNGAGFDLTVEFTLENTGTATLTDLQLYDDLSAQLGPHFGYVDAAPIITAGNASTAPTINSNYTNDTSLNILNGGELKPGESITIQLVVHVTPAATGTAELVNQATGGGTPVNPDGSPIHGGPTSDTSDSGSNPNGTNPGAPGDTGGTSDATSTSLQFYSYDSFNNFSRGFTQSGQNASSTEHQILSKQITTLAPEPSFSGSARPGTRIIGRIYNSSGHVIAEQMSMADMGGNWMMVMHNVASGDHNRIEFVEVVGQGDDFGSYGDIYGDLGIDGHSNNYGAMEPITSFGERFTVGSVYKNAPHQALGDDHRTNTNPLGFGV